ncbi:MAG TPA: hypothetical protein VG455_02555 [Acidimicrobiales bacterium]|nr:hypothetical protein [Acidimicrobiales bacterium]
MRILRAYDAAVADDEDTVPTDGPTALPGVGARIVAFVAICVAGLCGLLIGMALVRVGCEGSCAPAEGVGAVIGAVGAAGGVAVVAVLVLRAMGEWQAGAGRR